MVDERTVIETKKTVGIRFVPRGGAESYKKLNAVSAL